MPLGLPPSGKRPLVSLIFPSRGRSQMAFRTARRALELADDPSQVEIIVRLDDDDAITYGFPGFPSGTHTIIGPRLSGYESMDVFWNELFRLSTGEWIFCFNDDIELTERGWDSAIACFPPHEWRVLCPPRTNEQITLSHFPIVPRWIPERMGGLTEMWCVDNWLTNVLEPTIGFEWHEVPELAIRHNLTEVHAGVPDEAARQNWIRHQDEWIKRVLAARNRVTGHAVPTGDDMGVMKDLVPHGGHWVHRNDPGEETRGDGTPRKSITEAEALTLQALATGKRVLEIGTGTGYSAAMLAVTARAVLTLDISEFVKTNVWPELRKMQHVLCMDGSPEERERLLAMKPTYDLVFIDGNHATEACLEDLHFASKVIKRPGGLIALHDAKDPRVQEAVRAVDAPFGFFIPTEIGIYVLGVRA